MRVGKTVLTGLAIFFGIIILAGAGLGVLSQQPPELGLIDGKLRPCPDTPNCVCSEASHTDAMHFIEPIPVPADRADTAWEKLLEAVQGEGGEVKLQSDGYMHATFTSMIFRYVDDVEARLDDDAGLIHLRSASRVGHSDLGANRKRIEGIRKRYEGLYGQH